MSSSSIPAAVDYLVGLATQAVVGIPGAVVADGWTDERSGAMFGVGTDAPPFFEGESTTIEGPPSWAGLGAKRIEEDYTIPCYIYVGIGGVDNRAVRASAFSVWDAFLPLVIADLTLGGALKGGRYAEITTLGAQGPKTPEEAQGGRYCLIRFSVHCRSLIPS